MDGLGIVLWPFLLLRLRPQEVIHVVVLGALGIALVASWVEQASFFIHATRVADHRVAHQQC